MGNYLSSHSSTGLEKCLWQPSGKINQLVQTTGCSKAEDPTPYKQFCCGELLKVAEGHNENNIGQGKQWNEC